MRHTVMGGSLPAQPAPCAPFAGAAPLVLCQRDGRADDGLCRVEIVGRSLALTRLVGGRDACRIVPLASYEGIAAVRFGTGQGHGVALLLPHADPALAVTLHAAPDDADLVAAWRFWCARLALPMLAQGPDGAYRPATTMLGAVVTGAVQRRRRLSRIGRARSVALRRASSAPARHPVRA
ncbi:DUF6101 family protein [Ancylobacter sp. 6x-1]|uniref:DUF6101 family protein n=1 Tax=Ancylobacter crimeensis TaxID=2579147 RepID=A0ABT0DE17_9HYPH|nr:DUF6101 family protein [Ancylobacter crimeensis]MCK0197987.1 DUF6101 family protein [Ancylobacter crimeensis]